MSHRRSSLCLLVSLVLLAWPAATPRAAPRQRLFPETGWRVDGPLLAFWEAGGRLPVFGLPLGPEQAGVGGRRFQNFERARLELHPEQAAPYDVALGRLGAELLAHQGRDWRRATGASAFDEPCLAFGETGREVCGPFLAYWRSHGLELGDAGISWRESLALFGLPLTPATVGQLPSGQRLIVQWFERARFEYHSANPEPYKVLLGRLGAEMVGEPPALPRPTVHVAPRTAIVQGHTLQVDVQIAEAVGVGGTLGNTQLTFARLRSSWSALGAIAALQPPGPLPLSVEATLPDGRAAVATLELQVLDARYPVQPIDLPQAVEDSLARNQAALAQERARVNAIWSIVTPERLWQGRFAMPAVGQIVSSFGVGRAYDGGPVDSYHEGVDIKNDAGTPIVAPARGRVVLTEPNFVARGGAVILDHGWGVHTGYWHLEQLLVSEGQLIEAGQLIGLMGTRGMSTGPHLHWEMHIGPTSVDPLEWVEREWLAER